jgi:hypothetical protein
MVSQSGNMSITLIESQPITFRTAFETDSDCNAINNKVYCQMYNQADTVTAQWKQTPCGNNLSCWTSFDTCLACDITGVDYNSDDWTLGAHWTQGSNKIAVDSIGVSPGNATWDATTPLIEGHCYILTYTVTEYVGGSVQAILGGATGDLGSVNADGSYTEIFVCGASNTLVFDPANSTKLKIQDVYLYDMGCLCADSDGSNSIDISDNTQICHIAGVSATVSGFATLTPNKYYKAVVTVENATAGYITMDFYASPEQFTGNGSFTVYATANTTDFVIGMSSQFDGCITAVEIYEMSGSDSFEVGLYDLDGNYIAPISTFGYSSNISFQNEFVTLQWSIADGDAYGNPISNGCYQICFVDPCPELYGAFVSGAIIKIDNFDDPADWTLEDHITIADGAMTFTSTTDPFTALAASEYPIDCYDECNYTVRIDFGAIDVRYLGTTFTFTMVNDITVTITQDVIDNLSVTFETGAIDCQQGPITLEIPINIEFTSLDLPGDSLNPTAVLELTSITVALNQECFFAESDRICSNCISIKDTHDCTALLTAYCNEPALGFNFDTFKLYQRLRVLFINPTSKNRNENYLLSNGTYYKNFATRDKIFDVLFDYVDEVAHDAINTMLICDTLKIQSDGIPNNDEYIWLDDSYKPEWESQGRMNIAQSRIQIQRKSGVLTNSNCS